MSAQNSNNSTEEPKRRNLLPKSPIKGGGDNNGNMSLFIIMGIVALLGFFIMFSGSSQIEINQKDKTGTYSQGDIWWHCGAWIEQFSIGLKPMDICRLSRRLTMRRNCQTRRSRWKFD